MQQDLDTQPAPRLVRQDAELRKPHEMIVMVPRSTRVTLIARKIYNGMLHIAQAKMAAMESMPAADFVFEAPLPTILKSTGSNGEDRTVAKKYIKEMRNLEVDWESTAPGDGLKWMGFSMLSQASIEVRGGENWVSWAYPPAIMAALREPTRWARLDLSIMATLGTYSAVALYEICARYRDNPSGVTSRKPVTWWANALSHTPAGSEKREWRKFKNERVKPAIDEINRETDLEVEMIEFKEGRVITEVQFSVRKKKAPLRDESGTPVDPGLVIQAELLGIREIKLEGLINEFGEEAVRQQVQVLEKRGPSGHISRVNRFAELRGLLRGDVVQEQAQRELLMTDPNQQQPEEAPEESKIKAIKAEIALLDEGARKELGQRAADVLASKGLLSPVVLRRLEQGDILHGLLGATVVSLFNELALGKVSR